jgi:hypothetical protein
MPIRAYLDGHRFDQTDRLMGIAFEIVFVALQHTVGIDNPPRGRPEDYRACERGESAIQSVCARRL